MKITTNGCTEIKDSLTDEVFYACGIATVHSGGEDWQVESTFTIFKDGVIDAPYAAKSGETFNVMWTSGTPTTFVFQPQTATNVLIPLDEEFMEQYKRMWDVTNALAPSEPRIGMDVLIWHPVDERPLVEIE